jgi:hypothetical protein
MHWENYKYFLKQEKKSFAWKNYFWKKICNVFQIINPFSFLVTSFDPLVKPPKKCWKMKLHGSSTNSKTIQHL